MVKVRIREKAFSSFKVIFFSYKTYTHIKLSLRCRESKVGQKSNATPRNHHRV